MSFVIAPQGGLCNRIRVIDSGLALAQKRGQSLKVLWFRNDELNCPFDRLFQFRSELLNVEEVSAHGFIGKVRRSALPLLFSLRGYTCFSQADIVGHQAPDKLIDSALDFGGVFVSTYSRFFLPPSVYAHFTPAATIEEIVAKYRPKLQDAIAVHIRRTDNTQSIDAASLDDFVIAMERARQITAGCRFFLATDEPEVQRELISRFGSDIIFHPKRAYSRSDPAAIEDALVDLYCLAACRRLLGSYWSSFTDTAAQLGGIECEIVGAANGT